MAFDVRTLRASLRRDLAARATPVLGGEPLWASLSPESGRHLTRLTDWLARNKPDVYTVFADQDDVTLALADAAEQIDDIEWTLGDLLDRAVTDAVGTWVVPVPLVGVTTPAAARALDDGLVLAPASTWPKDTVDASSIQRDVASLVGAPAGIGSRYDRDGDHELIDTRRTATLICTLRGARGWCRRVAFEKSRFLVAAWTLFAPPEDELHTRMWPQVTEWFPQPQQHVREATHRIGPDGSVTEHRGMTVLHEPDDVALWRWPDDDELQVAVRAVNAVGRSRAAAALLTAAWDLYQAARNPSDAAWIERLVHIMHAREALSEAPDGDAENLEERFRAVCERLEIGEALTARGWGQRELQVMSGELRRLRNLATHGSDVSRLRLGHPPVRERPKLESPRVAEIYVREAASPAYHAVRELCLRLWTEMDACDYDVATFEDVFR